MAELSIFSSLHGYGGGPERDPLEDFTTGVLALILCRSGAFRRHFVERILKKANATFTDHDLIQLDSVEFMTQKHIVCKDRSGRLDREDHIKYLDLFFEIGSLAVVAGEHKVWARPDIDSKEGDTELRGKMQDYRDWIKEYAGIDRQSFLYFLAPFSPAYYLASYERELELPGHPVAITWTEIASLLRQSIDDTPDVFNKGLINEFIQFLENEEGLAMMIVGASGDTKIELDMLSSFVMQIEAALNALEYSNKPDKGGAAVLKAAGHYFTPLEDSATENQWWVGVYYKSPESLCVWVDDQCWAARGDGNPNTGKWKKDPEGGRFRDFPLKEGYFGKDVGGQIEFIKEHVKEAVSEMTESRTAPTARST